MLFKASISSLHCCLSCHSVAGVCAVDLNWHIPGYCKANRPLMHLDVDGMWFTIFQDDDDGNMYTSIQELRDKADELQQAVDECEKSGDLTKMEQLQEKLQSTQSQLLEKKEERHQARCQIRLYRHLTVVTHNVFSECAAVCCLPVSITNR